MVYAFNDNMRIVLTSVVTIMNQEKLKLSLDFNAVREVMRNSLVTYYGRLLSGSSFYVAVVGSKNISRCG